MSRPIKSLWAVASISVVLVVAQVGYSSSVGAAVPGDGGSAYSAVRAARPISVPRASDGNVDPAKPSADRGGLPRSNGQIVFDRVLDASTGNTAIYTVNPNGHGTQQLFSNPKGAELPHWSPDGREVSIFCCDDGMAAHIVNRDTGAFRELAPPDPTLEVHCGWWSPDGKRLACESFGLTDPSRTGVWTIRASDGGGLTQVTSNPGGDDIPGDFSPNGKRLVFVRSDPNGSVGIFVTKPGGGTPRQISPPGMLVEESFGGNWSPKANKILFVAQADQDHRRAIWVVHASGTGLHKLRMTPACGGSFSDPSSRSCYAPSWSPNGTKIAFSIFDAVTEQKHIYTSDADGGDVTQVTHGGFGDGNPDWGIAPVNG